MAHSVALLGTPLASDADSPTYQRIVTPPDDCVVIVHAVGRASSTPANPTISDSSGLTWITIGTDTSSPSKQRVWLAKVVGTSPGSITITVDWGTSIDGCCMAVFRDTGVNLTSPAVAGSVLGATGTGTTPAPGTVPSLANPNNAQILVVGHRRNASDASVESGWTELYDVNGSSPVNGACAYYRIASEDTTPTCTLGGSADWMARAFELAIAVAASGSAGGVDAGLVDNSLINERGLVA